MSLLVANNIVKTFIDGEKLIEVLRDVSLTIESGEMAAIIGASGSGKTTLLQLCGTLAQPDQGKLIYKGEDLLEKTSDELAQFRNRELGFIFQFHHLLPEFTTIENVMMPALISGKRKKEVFPRAANILKMVELDHRLDHKITNLSGGEQQRTALARALIMKPKLLLADEPTGNLDSRTGELVFKLLQNLCRELSLAVMMVTHNMDLARRMDTVLTLRDGYLIKG